LPMVITIHPANLTTIIFLTFIIIGAMSSNSVFSILRRRHFFIWEKLGSPELYFKGNIIDSLKFTKFLLTGKFKKLNDKSLNKLCYVTIFSMIVVMSIILTPAMREMCQEPIWRFYSIVFSLLVFCLLGRCARLRKSAFLLQSSRRFLPLALRRSAGASSCYPRMVLTAHVD